METALYHPTLGYYTSHHQIKGDYYTSPHVSTIFGRLLAHGLKEMTNHLEETTLVEIGGRGILAGDILQELDLPYMLVEPHLNINPPKGVEHYHSLEEIPPFTGIAFSNELMDALPVHLVEQTPHGLQEIYVDYQQGKFTEIHRPAPPVIREFLEKARIELPLGYRCEINLEALSLLEKINHRLKKGFILTIDYGHYSEETPRYPQGTLRCYYRHTQNTNPYQNIGKQDITSNVNFTSLIQHGKEIGLKLTGTTDQTKYILNLLEKTGEIKKYTLQERLKLKNLLMMGEAFQMLIQHKKIENPELGFLTTPP